MRDAAYRGDQPSPIGLLGDDEHDPSSPGRRWVAESGVLELCIDNGYVGEDEADAQDACRRRGPRIGARSLFRVQRNDPLASTRGAASGGRPVWSPDGSKIAVLVGDVDKHALRPEQAGGGAVDCRRFRFDPAANPDRIARPRGIGPGLGR